MQTLNADHTFTATTNGTGAWTTASTDLTAARIQALDEGAMTITASATGAGSGTRTVTYDITAPTITTGTLDLAAADDTGVNTDNITKNTTGLTISGTLSAAGATGDYVQLYSNGTKLSGATDTTLSNTAWTADTGLSEGAYAITAKVLDAAGNEGTASAALDITVDTTAPTYSSASVSYTGSKTVGSNTYLNTSDTIAVILNFSEVLGATQSTVQFKNDSTNLGSAVTATAGSSQDSGVSDAVFATDTNSGMSFSPVVSPIVREQLGGSKYVYKITQAAPKVRLRVTADGNVSWSVQGRTASSKPGVNDLATAGTAMVTRSSSGSNNTVSIDYTMTDVVSGTYFWFRPTENGITYENARLRVDIPSVATYTVASSDNVAAGNLKYDVTNESSLTDVAGNTLSGTIAEATISNTILDTTVPTISSARYSGSTIILTMSESVAVSGTKTGGDFTVTGGGAPTVSSYTISGSTITLTLNAAITGGGSVTLAYAKNATAANRIADTAGNELAAVSSQSVLNKRVSISAVSTDDYINTSEDENALTISGTSTNLTTGTTVTVAVDGSGTDISGKTGTTNSSGNWSVSLTSDEVKALDASSPDADGEDITITASAPDATSGTRTVTYDPTVPTISTIRALGTTLTVTMAESVYAATVPDTGDFVITGGGAPTISNITGLPTTAGAADNSFTMTISSALTGDATIAYTQNGTDSKRIKDAAGNAVASASSISIANKSVAVFRCLGRVCDGCGG